MNPYLTFSEHIDWHHQDVAQKAADLAEGCSSEETVAKKCFEFVRDSIKHSWDFKLNPVTCRASERRTRVEAKRSASCERCPSVDAAA